MCHNWSHFFQPELGCMLNVGGLMKLLGNLGKKFSTRLLFIVDVMVNVALLFIIHKLIHNFHNVLVDFVHWRPMHYLSDALCSVAVFPEIRAVGPQISFESLREFVFHLFRPFFCVDDQFFLQVDFRWWKQLMWFDLFQLESSLLFCQAKFGTSEVLQTSRTFIQRLYRI